MPENTIKCIFDGISDISEETRVREQQWLANMDKTITEQSQLCVETLEELQLTRNLVIRIMEELNACRFSGFNVKLVLSPETIGNVMKVYEGSRLDGRDDEVE